VQIKLEAGFVVTSGESPVCKTLLDQNGVKYDPKYLT
jgi:hypothetical protein